MKTLYRTLAVVALAVVVAPQARAEDIPNINKRGTDEKAFAEKMAVAIVKAARTSIKTATLEDFQKKSPKDGRAEYHLKASFKGAATGKAYEAEIVVTIDTSTADKWEVLRIDYNDNSKSVLGFNRKNVEGMVKKLNGN